MTRKIGDKIVITRVKKDQSYYKVGDEGVLRFYNDGGYWLAQFNNQYWISLKGSSFRNINRKVSVKKEEVVDQPYSPEFEDILELSHKQDLELETLQERFNKLTRDVNNAGCLLSFAGAVDLNQFTITRVK